MARIRKVLKGTQEIQPHPTLVDCFVQPIVVDGTVKYLHLSTFGSAARQSGPKSSQSLQFDLEASRALVQTLLATFGPLVLEPVG